MNGWKGLYSYVGFLVEARAGVEDDGKFEGPVGHARKSLLTARFLVRNRVQRVGNARRLSKARARPSRRADEPLVSVVIPTHNRCVLLMGRAIPSVLDQTYRNIELIVVGDGCTDDTERMVKGLASPRVKFFTLPEAAGRPGNGYDAWLVVGLDASNMGIALSSGEWIVHLDDDDELAPEHIETLLRHATEDDLEMIYPKVLLVTAQGERYELGSFPPEIAKMTHSGVMFDSDLKFFSYDRNTWRYLEPGDWNMWRRMNEAGVRIGFVDRVLGTIYPAGPAFYA